MMLSSQLLVFLSIAYLGCAETSARDPNITMPSLTERTGGAVHTVKVGDKGINSFDPDEIRADVGDIVEFNFYPLNHSVARAPFGNPCIPYIYGGLGIDGFWSGYQPINVMSSNPPKYRVMINDTEPVFFYCTHDASCLGHRMVGVINPNPSQTLASQIKAIHDNSMKSDPDEGWPGDGEGPLRSSQPSPIPQHPHQVLSPGGIAGITLGGLCILLIAAALFYLFTSRRAASQQLAKSTLPLPPSYIDGHHQPYLNSAHIPSKDAEYQGFHQRDGSYNYPAEADSSYIRSPVTKGNGIGLGMSEVEGDTGFPNTGPGPTRF